MNNVSCVKWGDKFSPEYVNRLYYAVRRNTTVPFKFHCFTEDMTGIDLDIQIHPLTHPEIPGWWQKLFLFSGELEFIQGRMLFLDLDTLIVGNIDKYITHKTGFVGLQDFWRKGDNFGSAVMNFEIGKHQYLWDQFKDDPEFHIKQYHPHGDQKWIMNYQAERFYWQQMYPNEIVSFKSHCRNGVPNGAKMICYHGKPSIEESLTITTRVQGFVIPPTPWVKEYWKDE